MVGPDSYGISRAPHYLGARLRDHSLSLTGLSPSTAGFPNTVQLENGFVTLRGNCSLPMAVPQPPIHNACKLTCIGFGLGPFRSPLLRASHSISLPPVTEMFHFTGSPPDSSGYGTSPARFPHSEIHGSQGAYPSPWLIVVRYVLRRHLAPRHPPRALNTLTSYFLYNTLYGLVMVRCKWWR